MPFFLFHAADTLFFFLSLTLSQIMIILGVRVEIDGAEGVLGARKRVRESVQQRPLRAEGETRSDVTVSVRRRAREFAGSSLRHGY